MFALGERGGAKPNPSLAPLPCLPLPLPGYFLESCISVATLCADTSGGLSADAGARKRVFPAWPPAGGRTAGSPALVLPQPWAPGRVAQWRPQCPQEHEGFCSARGSHSIKPEKQPLPNTHSFIIIISSHILGGQGDFVLVSLIGLVKQLRSYQEHKLQGHNLYLWV